MSNSVESINLKEPVITADMEYNEEESDLNFIGAGLPDFKKLADGTHKKTYIKCRSIRMGSYKVLMPTKEVLFIPEGIRITLPPISDGDKKEGEILDIPITKIVKILAHFGRCLPVFFVYVKPSVGRNIRKALKMTDPSGLYFDPCSSDESQTRITILPDKFMESSRTMFKDLYKSITQSIKTHASSSSTECCILDEIDQKEANEILVRSSPENLGVKQPQLTVNKKPQEDKSTGLPTPKQLGRGCDRGKSYKKKGYHQETEQFEFLEVNLDDEPYSNKKNNKNMKGGLQVGSSIKLSNEKCSIQRSLVDKKPSETVGTRIKLVNEPIVTDEPIARREPLITADMEKDDDRDNEKGTPEIGDSFPDFGNLEKESSKRPYTTLKCRSLRMGSYKVLMPTKEVVFVPEGISITIPPVIKGDKNEMVTIDIPMRKIVKILAHFGRSLPVFFVYVKSSVGSSIRKALRMTDPASYYFDPCSSDESQKRITILPDKFFESSRSIFKEIFSLASKTRTTDASSNTNVVYAGQSQVSTGASSHCLMEELDQKEANEILILSSPENLPMPNVNTATIRKHDEKDNAIASTKKIKSEETHNSVKDNSVTSTKMIKSEETQRSPAKNKLASFRVKKQQRKKQQIIIRGEGNQPIILEVEEDNYDDEEEDCDDPLAIDKTDEPFEPETVQLEQLPDLSIHASTLPQYRNIQPKTEPNTIRINKVDTDTGEENVRLNDWDKNVERIKKQQIDQLERNLEQIKKEKMEEINRNLAEKTLPSQTPIFLSIPNIDNSGQTVFQPKQNFEQKGNTVSPNKNGNGENQIIRIKQEKMEDGNNIILQPIQLAQGGTPQFIMFLPGDKSVPGVPVNLSKPP